MNLFSKIFQTLLHYGHLAVVKYGYWGVFFGVMLENAGVPVPGETILLVAGFYSANGHLRLWLVMLIAALGAAIGDNIGFAIGHHFGRGFLLKWGRYVFLTQHRIEYINSYFDRYGNKTVLVARFITGLRVFAALLAGASNMRWPVFLVYNVAGAIIWSVVISTLGYLFSNSLPLIEKWVGRSGVIFLVACIVIAAVVWRVRAHRK